MNPYYPPYYGYVYPTTFHNPVPESTESVDKEKWISKPKIRKTYKYIEIGRIQTLNDFIDLCDRNPYDPNYYYNIHLKGLHSVRYDLVELNNMIGLKELKTSLVEQMIYFLQNLHLPNDRRKKQEGDYKHTVIYGPPGTGKTEIAKILGRIYSKLGILRNHTFKKVTRSDLVAEYLGQTAIKTRKIIDECLGGVLFIDEAYSLGSDRLDNFSKECIDTLCEALSEHKTDLMVIIAGYEKELNDYFFAMNPGLQSRFLWRFHIHEYTSDELYHIYRRTIEKHGWTVDVPDEKKMIEWFDKKKKFFIHYGRDIENLFFMIKIAHSNRIFGKEGVIRKRIIQEDMDKGSEKFFNNPEIKKRERDRLIHSIYI